MVSKKVVMHFPAAVVEQPFIFFLIKEHDLMVNILRGNINPRKEGKLVVELSGEDDNYKDALEFLQSRGVKIFPLEQEIVWVEERCTHCGACAVICPTGALAIKRPEMTVHFENEKCIVCEHCLKACPARAMEARF